MDWKMYSEELEKIIDAIYMPKHTRYLVNGLIRLAKEKSKKRGGDND